MKKILTLILTTILISCSILGDKKQEDNSFLLALALGRSASSNNEEVVLNAFLNLDGAVALGQTSKSSLGKNTGSGDTIVGLSDTGTILDILKSDGNLPSIQQIYTTPTNKDIYIRFATSGLFTRFSTKLNRSTTESVRCILATVRKSDNKLVCLDTDVTSFSVSEPVKFDKEENIYYLAKNSANSNILRNKEKVNFIPNSNSVTLQDFYVREKDKVAVNGTSSGSPWVRVLEPNKSTTIPQTTDFEGVKSVFSDMNDDLVYMFNKKDTYNTTGLSNLPITKKLNGTSLINFFASTELEKVSNPGAFTRCRSGGVTNAFTVEHFDCITSQFTNYETVKYVNSATGDKIDFIVSQDTDSTQPLRGNSRKSLYRLIPASGGQYTIRYVPLLSNLATREVAVTWISKIISNGNRLLIAGRNNSQYVFYVFNPLSESVTYPGFYNSPLRYLSDINLEVFEITPIDDNNIILEGINHDTNQNVVITLNLLTSARTITYPTSRVTNISKL
jgi:hypothetical protein